jgi:hypothetical protein
VFRLIRETVIAIGDDRILQPGRISSALKVTAPAAVDRWRSRFV